jgi:hypothetical protein
MIPVVVQFGRRTIQQQSVTSAAFICLDSQANIFATSVGTIASEMQVEVTGLTAKGRPSKAKNPRFRKVSIQSGVRVPLSVLIVMARTNPLSRYNALTGSRWALELGNLPTGKGTAAARQAMIGQWVSEMTLARRSSTHFLQHGWQPAISRLLNDPLYYGGRSNIPSQIKSNAMDNAGLGYAIVELIGDACVVTCENAIGSSGNVVLAAKHREALIRESGPPLVAAIAKEEAVMLARIQMKIDEARQFVT